MNSNEVSVGVLSDLIRINNDRIAGYQRAITETKDLDIDLKATFGNLIEDSKRYKQQLTDKLVGMGGVVPSDTTLAGKIYRAWMDVKASFTGKDRLAILASCEYGEDAAKKAYNDAIAQGTELDADALILIEDQQQSLLKAHDLIKNLRDAHAAIR